MPKFSDENYHTQKYWNERTKYGIAKNNLNDMIFEDPRLSRYRERVGKLLQTIPAHWKVLDVCCGYGYHAQWFKPEQYIGVDFSEEMIKLAKQKNPAYNFWVADMVDFPTLRQFDFVFEVNSGRVLYDDDQEKIKKLLWKYATKAIAILEVDYMGIWYAKNI